MARHPPRPKRKAGGEEPSARVRYSPQTSKLEITTLWHGKLIQFHLNSEHLKHTGPDVDSGLIVLGGAMLEEPIKEGVPPKMKGSVLMCVADTEEEVLERVKRDAYWTGDVWDKEKVSEFGWCRGSGWEDRVEVSRRPMLTTWIGSGYSIQECY
jgi:hypothetical protein